MHCIMRTRLKWKFHFKRTTFWAPTVSHVLLIHLKQLSQYSNCFCVENGASGCSVGKLYELFSQNNGAAVKTFRPAEMFHTGSNFKVSKLLIRCHFICKNCVNDNAMMLKRIPVTYHEVFKYLSNKTVTRYPEGCSDARKWAIRKFSDKVLLENGVLFYVRSDSEEKQNAKRKTAVDRW